MKEGIDAPYRLAGCVGAQGCEIAEIEINPLLVLPDRVCAIDIPMCVAVSA